MKKPHRGGLAISTRGGVALLVQARDRLLSNAKLLAPHVATLIWTHAYGPFEYPGEDPSVDCTSHPGVRSVSLIDSGLTLLTTGWWASGLEVVTTTDTDPSSNTPVATECFTPTPSLKLTRRWCRVLG